jgi:chitodextrinase
MKKFGAELLTAVLICMYLSGCSGAEGTSNPSMVDTSAPTMPAGLTATAGSSSSIGLNWNASTDNVVVTGYKIYRGGSQVGTSASNSYNDSGLASSATYTYTVAAYDAAGNNSEQSASASATTLAPGQTDTQAPTAPVNLAATAVSASQINLSWTASTDDAAVAGYDVWRGTVKISTTTTTSYSDTSLSASTTYTYTVKAFDGTGNVSEASNEASATTQAVGAGSLRVRVLDWSDARISNAIVVLGDSNGAIITHGTTDANGEITFNNPPASATITSANTFTFCDSWQKRLSVIYDVNIPEVTVFVPDCDTHTTPLGDITVNVTNIPEGVSQIDISSGDTVRVNISESAISNNQAQATLTIYPHDLQSDEKMSIVAIARKNSQRHSYGILLDQTMTPGMTVTVAADQLFTNTIQYLLTNIPATTQSIYGDINQIRKEARADSIGTGKYELTSSVASTIMSIPYMPDFQDACYYGMYVRLGENSDGPSVGFWNWSGYATAPSNQPFDFSLMPIVPSDFAVSMETGTATPVYSWSGTDTNVDWITGGSSGFGFYASPSRTNLVFPELPDTLSDFRATTLPSFFTVSNDADSRISGYDDFLAKQDQWGWAYWNSPAFTHKWSVGYWSGTQISAPALTKAPAQSALNTPGSWPERHHFRPGSRW